MVQGIAHRKKSCGANKNLSSIFEASGIISIALLSLIIKTAVQMVW
jgi:hypothetical protein